MIAKNNQLSYQILANIILNFIDKDELSCLLNSTFKQPLYRTWQTPGKVK